MHNLFNWLLVVCTAFNKTNSDFAKLVERLEELVEQNSQFENDVGHEVKFIPSDEMVAILKPIVKSLSRKDKMKWAEIIKYFLFLKSHIRIWI